MSSHRSPRRIPRSRPMPGRGQHGAYPLASWRETFGALSGLAYLPVSYFTRKDQST